LLLSTPLTACLVVLGRYVPYMRFLAILLGDRPVLKIPEQYYQRLLARDQDEAIDLVEEYLKQHSVREAYENILLPALVMTKQDKARDDFTDDDERNILLAVREMADDLAHLYKKEKQEQGEAKPADVSEGAQVLVLGCPANDEADELALYIFGQILDASRLRFEVLPAGTLAGEVVTRVREENVGLACVGVLPASGYASARYLCKRLHNEVSGLKIVVGCWGLDDTAKQVRERLRTAGADQVGVTFEETRSQILPLALVIGQARPRAVAAH
jgi:hypothetical protein